MDQIGRIAKVTEDGYAQVYIERNSACEKCGICHMGETQELLLTIPNTIKAKSGDRVMVNLHGSGLLKAGFIAYVVPIIALLVGLVGGFYLASRLQFAGPDLWGIGLGLLGMVVSYLVIRRMEPRFQKSGDYSPELVRVVDEFESIGDDTCGK